MNMNKPPDETLKQGRNRSWLLVKNYSFFHLSPIVGQILMTDQLFGTSIIFIVNIG